jgi:hypothetical protein
MKIRLILAGLAADTVQKKLGKKSEGERAKKTTKHLFQSPAPEPR